MSILHLLSSGAADSDMALAAVRVTVGVFFALSGYHKLFNRGRHASFVETLKADHVPALRFNQWWVPSVELLGGIAVAAGFLTSGAALMLLAICIVACVAEASAKVESFKPIDEADRIDDWLYLPEVLYALMLFAVICAGPGGYSIDRLLGL